MQKDSNYAARNYQSLSNDVYLNLGQAYYTLHDYDQSLRYMYKAINIQPNSGLEYVTIGNSLFNNHLYDEALEYYDKAIATDNNYANAYYGRGLIYYEQSNYGLALDMFNQYLSSHDISNSERFEGNLYKIYCYIYLQDYEQAEALIKYLQTDYEDSNDLEFARVKGYFYSLTKSFDETEAYYKTVKSTMADVDGQSLLGEYYYEQELYSLALKEFLGLNEKYPQHIPLQQYILYSYSALQEYEENTLKYAKLSTDINSMNTYSNDLIRIALERMNPIGDQIRSFVTNNYLYHKSTPSSLEDLKKLFPNHDMDNKNISDSVEAIRKDDDYFTYTLFEEDYDLLDEFRQIYILIDEYSASASEMLTLVLKTYLDNVTVIGIPSFGKGVGQLIYANHERKLLVYIVNHFWNVHEQNIMYTGITPDIIVDSDNLEDYLAAIPADK